jgi:uncharacterized protein (DUF58 family)
VAAGAVVLVAAGRVFGIFELFVLAAGALAALAVGAVAVRFGRVELEADRQLRPSRVHAGSESRVELTVHNQGRVRSPVVALHDRLAPSSPTAGRDTSATKPRHARFLLAPLGPGEHDRATYRLPTERRGTFRMGPLEARVGDALGLWSRRLVVAPEIELTVYPTVEPVAALPRSGGDDPGGGHRPSLGPTGEDFFGLRPYQVGDDLRRVHWPSTARVGELLVRQLEQPWQGRATVLADLRGSVHDDASLEAAVSAAACLLTASWQAGALVRLVTSAGLDSGFAPGHAHLEAVMEHLAVVGASPDDDLHAVLARLRRTGNGGAVAVITTDDAAGADLEAFARLRGRFDWLSIVILGAAHPGPTGTVGGARLGRATVVPVAPSAGFAAAWSRFTSLQTAGATPAGPRPRPRP